jgi:hypothetical protein
MIIRKNESKSKDDKELESKISTPRAYEKEREREYFC